MDPSSKSNVHRPRTNSNYEPDFAAGVCPQYWAYTRMSVVDVLNLKLKNGVNWLQPALSNTELSTPVSKCLLVGHIVYAAERRGGSMVYILDDGTGLIDCVHWFGNDGNNLEDPYYLPSLVDPPDDQEHRRGFAVGETVRVFGKIECLASTSTSNSTTTHRGAKFGGNDDAFKEKVVVREVQVRIIERVEDYFMSEASHWIDSYRLGPVSLRSCLDTLGPQIRQQIQNRTNLPAADDRSGSWRVFGINCRCKLPYMEDLLYCHCQCKTEPLDPFFRFRDALLNKLLAMESMAKKRLEFKYKEIRSDCNLQTVAMKEIMTDEKITEKNDLTDKLFLKTFQALRGDGIIYLLNSNTDDYLFITRKKVLEPFVKRECSGTAQSFISFERSPKFISRVHNERLLYIKRLLDGEFKSEKSY